MKQHINILTLFVLTLSIFLGACSEVLTLVEKTPFEIYEEFYYHCETGDLATASTFVTDEAILDARSEGTDVCASYKHDGINDIAGHEVVEYSTFEPDDILIAGDTAYLLWDWNEYRFLKITMYKIDGEWKINDSLIYEK